MEAQHKEPTVARAGYSDGGRHLGDYRQRRHVVAHGKSTAGMFIVAEIDAISTAASVSFSHYRRILTEAFSSS